MFEAFENQFKNKTELLDWYEKNNPERFFEFSKLKNKIKDSNFSGHAKLLKRENQIPVDKFMDYLTELNFANILLERNIKNFSYEPKSPSEVDFSQVDFKFDNLLVSIKSIHEKNPYKLENAEFIKMSSNLIKRKSFKHPKGFSNVTLQIEKGVMGADSWSRSEFSSSGELGSDICLMSPILQNIGLFDCFRVPNLKKIIFFMNYDPNFKFYHMDDIAKWYFDDYGGSYEFIFKADPSWYFKMFAQGIKNNFVDCIIFMAYPDDVFMWPQGCFDQAKNKRKRLQIYTKDKSLYDFFVAFFGLSNS